MGEVQDVLHLGAQDYPVSPFLFDELEEAIPLFSKALWEDAPFPDALKAAKQLVRMAVPEADLKDARCSFTQLMDAVAAIARVSGLVELGERVAQAAKSPTSGSSQPSSAPKQDGRRRTSES